MCNKGIRDYGTMRLEIISLRMYVYIPLLVLCNAVQERWLSKADRYARASMQRGVYASHVMIIMCLFLVMEISTLALSH